MDRVLDTRKDEKGTVRFEARKVDGENSQPKRFPHRPGRVRERKASSLIDDELVIGSSVEGELLSKKATDGGMLYTSIQ